MKCNLKVIFCFICLGYSLSSQDLHFSLFNETPALINPALTGAEGRLRISIINKDQWKSVTNAYKTYGATFETKFPADGFKKTKKSTMSVRKKGFSGINAGLSFFSDKAGDGMLAINRCNLSVSSFVAISKHNSIAVGLQGSLVQGKFDYGNLLFPNQYNGTIYDPNQASKENFVNQRYIYFDAAAGALWSYNNEAKNFDVKKQFRSHVGFSVYHITKPKVDFEDTHNGNYLKFVAHGDLIKSLGNSNLAIAPSYLIQMQGSSKEFLIGAMLRHHFKGNSQYTGYNKQSTFGYGVYYRSNDAIIFSMLLELQEKYAIIFGYDLNTSSLKQASSRRGGFEICLRYSTPKSSIYKRK